jgi:hypothetical protein
LLGRSSIARLLLMLLPACLVVVLMRSILHPLQQCAM